MRIYSTVGALAVAAVTVIGCARSGRVVSESPGAVYGGVVPVDARTLPSGVDMQLRLDQAVGTRQSRVGQDFTATVRNTVYAQNGRVVVPAGARVHGRVTGLREAQPGQPAVIRLNFERISFNRRSYPFEASITATDLETSGGGVRGRDVAIGAAAGAVLGAIISDASLRGILGGAALGAAAGTVISLGTSDAQATLPAGSTINVRTTQAVALR